MGSFEAVDMGSEAKRVVLGFGSGAADLRTAVEGYLMTQQGLRRLGSGTLGSREGKTPGIAVSLPASSRPSSISQRSSRAARAPSGWGTSIRHSSCPPQSPVPSSGGGADVHAADGDGLAPRHWQVEHGPSGRGADHPRPLGVRRARESAVVVRRLERDGRESAADPAVRELQPPERLVPVERPDHHGELRGQPWQHVDRAGGRRCGEAVQARQAAAEHPAPGLLQRRAAPVRGGLATALPAAVPVPEVGRRSTHESTSEGWRVRPSC